jgi:hypothetical protein
MRFDAWVARGDINIEDILRVVLKSVNSVDMKIAEANALTEIAQIPLIIENVMTRGRQRFMKRLIAACGRITQ